MAGWLKTAWLDFNTGDSCFISISVGRAPQTSWPTLDNVFFTCSIADYVKCTVPKCGYESILYLQSKQKSQFWESWDTISTKLTCNSKCIQCFSLSGCCLTDVGLYLLWINIMRTQYTFRPINSDIIKHRNKETHHDENSYLLFVFLVMLNAPIYFFDLI